MINQLARWQSMFYISEKLKRIHWGVDRKERKIGDPAGYSFHDAVHVTLDGRNINIGFIGHVMLYGYGHQFDKPLWVHNRRDICKDNIWKGHIETPDETPLLVVRPNGADVVYSAFSSAQTLRSVRTVTRCDRGFETPYHAYLHLCKIDELLFGEFSWNFHDAGDQTWLSEDAFMELFDRDRIAGIHKVEGVDYDKVQR